MRPGAPAVRWLRAPQTLRLPNASARQQANDPAAGYYGALFLAVTFWPYSALDRELTTAFLVTVSILALVLRPQQLPNLSKPLIVFIAYVLAVVFLDALRGGVGRYYLSHSNHILQFVLYYVAISKLVQSVDWQQLITSSWFITAGLVYSTIYYCVFRDIDLNIALYATVIGIFLRGHHEGRTGEFLLLLAIGLALSIFVGRLSVILVMTVIPIFYLWRPKRVVVIAIASMVLVAPVAFYLLIDVPTLRWLYALDHNTAIRAEFVRAATSLLQQSPLLGIGFDAPYRPTAFPYLEAHPYLNDPVAVQTISNHHSLFDLALRLGLPAAILFWFGIVHMRRNESNALWAMLCLIAAIGLSFNAWFENQYQLPQFVLTIALMQMLPGRSEAASSSDPGARTTFGRSHAGIASTDSPPTKRTWMQGGKRPRW